MCRMLDCRGVGWIRFSCREISDLRESTLVLWVLLSSPSGPGSACHCQPCLAWASCLWGVLGGNLLASPSWVLRSTPSGCCTWPGTLIGSSPCSSAALTPCPTGVYLKKRISVTFCIILVLNSIFHEINYLEWQLVGFNGVTETIQHYWTTYPYLL